MSDCFKIERGVRQGCPLSPYLFVLSVEVLANAIRRDPRSKGISISQIEIKLSQYADDTTSILDGSQDTLETSLDVIEKFSKISGLRLNNKKTEALWIRTLVSRKRFQMARAQNQNTRSLALVRA